MAGSDFTALQGAINALTVQATQTVGTEDSAEVVINGFSAQVSTAVAAALADDDAADQGSIQAAQAAIATVTRQFTDSSAKLGAAISANPGTPGSPAAR